MSIYEVTTPSLQSRVIYSLASYATHYGGIWVATVLLGIVSLVIAPATLGPTALVSLLPFAAILALAAVGETIVIRQRGIDLSVPGTMVLSGIIAAKLVQAGIPVEAALAVVFVVALTIGVVNGILITVFSVTPLVATLAMNSILLGGVLTYAQGFPVSAGEPLRAIAESRIGGVSTIVVVALVYTAVLAAFIKFTIAGRRFVAVGESAPAARAAGIRTRRFEFASYAIAAVCYATAGVLLAGYTGTATTSDLAGSYLLPAIAAVVIGGTPLTGGRGSLLATVVAALFLTQLGQLVSALGAPPASQLIVQAAAIAVATGSREVWRRVRGSVRDLRGPRRPLVTTASGAPS